MRKQVLMKKGLVFLLVFPLAAFFYCGGKRTTRTAEPEYKFSINGVVVKDLSIGKDIAYFTILRDSVIFDSAVVKVGRYTLPSQGDGIYFGQTNHPAHLFDFGDAVAITVSSAGDDFAANLNLIIPGSFSITDITGISGREVLSGQSPRVLFTASADASGYFVSVVPRDNAEGAQGHTSLVPWSGVGQCTIPVDTFTDRIGVFTEGTYAIYLVAYNKSFAAYPPYMEFELPDGLPKDNIPGANGTIGAGVVAPLDSVEAVSGQ
jgi:hypothetical protein